MMLIYPKNSTAIKCRQDFYSVVSTLYWRVSQQTSPTENETKRTADLLEFRKIVNYHNRHGIVFEIEEEEDEEYFAENENFSVIPVFLFSLCNSLKAKEEGISLCRHYAEYSAHPGLGREVLSKLAEFVGLAGWDVCREFFNSIVSNDKSLQELTLLFHMASQLLKMDSPFRNEAALDVFNQLYDILFPPTETLSVELFASKVDSIISDYHNFPFIGIILQLEKRQLLDNAQQLITATESYLVTKPITVYSFHHLIVTDFCTSSFFADSSFNQLSERLQNLLQSLCKHFLDGDIHGGITNPSSVVFWIKMFVFVCRPFVVQHFIDKICFHPLASSDDSSRSLGKFLNGVLNSKQWQMDPQLKAAKSQLTRTYHCLLRRERFEIRQSISHLKNVVSRINAAHISFPGMSTDLNVFRLAAEFSASSQLPKIVDSRLQIPLNSKYWSKEEAEEELTSLCDLIGICSELQMKAEGLRAIAFYAPDKEFPIEFWLRPEFLSVLAEFIVVNNWNTFSIIPGNPNSIHFSSNRNRAQFLISLSNELLLNKSKNRVVNYPTLRAFQEFCSLLCFLFDEDSQLRNFTINFSTLDERHRNEFFHVVLLLDSVIIHYPTVGIKGIQILRDSPIPTLHHFVKFLFSRKCSPLMTSFQSSNSTRLLTPRVKKTLEFLCGKFVDYIRYEQDTIVTEDLLNWMRFIAFVGTPEVVRCLMDHLCFQLNLEGSCNVSIEKLLSSEEFQTESHLKVYREHVVLACWKRQQQTKSFVKLFSTRIRSSNKRKKLPMPSSVPNMSSSPKRARCIWNSERKSE